MTPKEVLSLCRQKDVKAVDLRFTDFFGCWQHLTIPVGRLDEDLFEDGLGLDGSSLRGWQEIHESDMLVVPQSETAYLDPFATLPTMTILCHVQDPLTRDEYSRDPRYIAKKAVNYLIRSGFADTAFFGPEAEFFVFDKVRFDQSAQHSFYQIDSREAYWNRGNEQANGNILRPNGGYFPTPPADQLMDVRNQMMQTMIDCGLDVECHHHEVASAGQCEIDLRYNDLVSMADAMMIYKYVVRNVAVRNNLVATFMPKPIFGENGSGMHTHFSLWKEGDPLFSGCEYAGLSDMALHAIGGILRHAPALLALTNPSTNSFKRLVPGYEAPVNLVYSQRNRSAACRIPMYSPSPAAKRIEFRCPDATCNPYLAFAAILMAALDGIQNKLNPGEPYDHNAYQAETDLPNAPGSLDEALTALQNDHEFLLKGDVFTPDVIQTWIHYKRENEIKPLRLQPHPLEYCMYFDA
ncbi:MAG: type I glutamate--ammonia ligase [Planctomycetales bacterium]|nr:type I glutamate--ammonia ligase [Planctomycetales bacterium]